MLLVPARLLRPAFRAALPPSSPYYLEYGRGRRRRHAIYRLKAGEALYSSVVVRFHRPPLLRRRQRPVRRSGEVQQDPRRDPHSGRLQGQDPARRAAAGVPAGGRPAAPGVGGGPDRERPVCQPGGGRQAAGGDCRARRRTWRAGRRRLGPGHLGESLRLRHHGTHQAAARALHRGAGDRHDQRRQRLRHSKTATGCRTRGTTGC